MKVFPCDQSPLLIPGAVGPLQAELQCSAENRDEVAIICHPHPLYGGSLHNKVVHTLAKSLCQSGLHALRFNFRGVGQSAGEYDHGRGEQDDLLAVVGWVKESLPQARITLGGFSFGAWIALMACEQVAPRQLLAVAPPIHTLGFATPHAPCCPVLLVQGEEDDVIEPQQVYDWAESWQQVHLLRVAGAGHFFHGRLNQLQTLVMENFPIDS